MWAKQLRPALTNMRVMPASEDHKCGTANRRSVVATAELNPKVIPNIAEEFAIFAESLDRL